jgi:hypothetical protein
MFLYSVCSILIGVFFITCNYKKIKRKVTHQHSRFKRLNSLVATKHKTQVMIILVSIYMLFESYYINLLQSLNKSFIKIDKNTFEITYILHGKIYKILVQNPRGPCKIEKIIDQNEKNIDDLVFPYIGPVGNFHNCIFTPKFFKCSSIYFYNFDGTVEKFNDNDHIILKT